MLFSCVVRNLLNENAQLQHDKKTLKEALENQKKEYNTLNMVGYLLSLAKTSKTNLIHDNINDDSIWLCP